jgi:hypothetical protein
MSGADADLLETAKLLGAMAILRTNGQTTDELRRDLLAAPAATWRGLLAMAGALLSGSRSSSASRSGDAPVFMTRFMTNPRRTS